MVVPSVKMPPCTSQDNEHCINPPEVHKVLWKDFASKWPAAYEFLKQLQMDAGQQQKMMLCPSVSVMTPRSMARGGLPARKPFQASTARAHKSIVVRVSSRVAPGQLVALEAFVPAHRFCRLTLQRGLVGTRLSAVGLELDHDVGPDGAQLLHHGLEDLDRA